MSDTPLAPPFKDCWVVIGTEMLPATITDVRVCQSIKYAGDTPKFSMAITAKTLPGDSVFAGRDCTVTPGEILSREQPLSIVEVTDAAAHRWINAPNITLGVRQRREQILADSSSQFVARPWIRIGDRPGFNLISRRAGTDGFTVELDRHFLLTETELRLVEGSPLNEQKSFVQWCDEMINQAWTDWAFDDDASPPQQSVPRG